MIKLLFKFGSFCLRAYLLAHRDDKLKLGFDEAHSSPDPRLQKMGQGFFSKTSQKWISFNTYLHFAHPGLRSTQTDLNSDKPKKSSVMQQSDISHDSEAALNFSLSNNLYI